MYINKWSFKEELDSLVDTRNLARKNLHDQLTMCVEELEVMPLDVRHQCVTVSQSEIFSIKKYLLSLNG